MPQSLKAELHLFANPVGDATLVTTPAKSTSKSQRPSNRMARKPCSSMNGLNWIGVERRLRIHVPATSPTALAGDEVRVLRQQRSHPREVADRAKQVRHLRIVNKEAHQLGA